MARAYAESKYGPMPDIIMRSPAAAAAANPFGYALGPVARTRQSPRSFAADPFGSSYEEDEPVQRPTRRQSPRRTAAASPVRRQSPRRTASPQRVTKKRQSHTAGSRPGRCTHPPPCREPYTQRFFSKHADKQGCCRKPTGMTPTRGRRRAYDVLERLTGIPGVSGQRQFEALRGVRNL